MRYSTSVVAALAGLVAADTPKPGDDGRYTISAEGIKAQVLKEHANA